MITALLSLFGSPLIGTLTGFFGAWLTKREDRLCLELKQAHDLELSKLNHFQKIEYAKIQGDLDVQQVDAESFKEAVIASGGSSIGKIAEFLKSGIRPFITLYLLVCVSIIAYQLSKLVGGLDVLNSEELTEMFKQVIQEILYLFTMSVSFWFGIRPSQKRS